MKHELELLLLDSLFRTPRANIIALKLSRVLLPQLVVDGLDRGFVY
jgi:hypothetical protein